MAFRWVSDVARLLGARPRDLSDLFYQRLLSDEICPVVGGRRIIPDHYVGEIKRVLRERGLISASQTETEP